MKTPSASAIDEAETWLLKQGIQRGTKRHWLDRPSVSVLTRKGKRKIKESGLDPALALAVYIEEQRAERAESEARHKRELEFLGKFVDHGKIDAFNKLDATEFTTQEVA